MLHPCSRTLLAGTALVSILTAAVASQAQEVTDPVVLDQIILDASRGEFLTADPSTTVDEEDIEDVRTGDIKDVFQKEASIATGGAQPIAQKFYVNGVDQGNLNINIDAAPRPNAATHHTTANYIDPGLLRSVGVAGTVAPASAGPFALGGAVAFETISASDFLRAGQTMGGSVTLGYDGNGDTRTGALTLAAQHDGFEILGYAKRADGNEYEDGDGTSYPGTATDYTSYLLKAGYTTGDHVFRLSTQTITDDAPRTQRPNFGGFNTGRPHPVIKSKLRQASHSIRYSYAGSNLFNPELTLAYSKSDYDIDDPSSTQTNADILKFKAMNTATFGAATVEYGFDVTHAEVEYKGTWDASVADGADETSKVFGLFAQGEYEFSNVTLSGGVRYDTQSFEGLNDFDDDVDGFSGNMSARYAVTDTLDLYAGYANVFGGIELTDAFSIDPTAWAYTDLDPSRAKNWKAGMEYDDGRITAGLEAFDISIDNARDVDRNVDFRSRGFNARLGYSWLGGEAGITVARATPEIDGDDAGAYETLDLGAPLGTMAAIYARHEFGDTGLTLGGTIEFADDYRTDSPDPDSDREIDGYAVLNLSAEYQIATMKGAVLRLDIKNVFDETYADRGSYGQEYSSLIPLNEPGRNIGIRLDFKL
ncbi:hemoglobin/transferrin/lactoferrin receptor protein [Paracoccus halophilus]|uniref:Hemoglobin/transferrin/lactoferrin receptor protein n=1 Tax=Paracoccus halophilus TaxID=376733 RepID=A0A099EXS0_9RHOB|nr:TonB-dependent receptor [Paracoccus halophilus]KGJ02786.1 hypothetical protein IT41_16355 [Paracoccus halophilus]SFA59992.1 hemoglobin/transferrin/lactoferrin receptor protein [Paracoccus halophilus]